MVDDPELFGDENDVVLDFCGRKLRRLEKAPPNQAYATSLILDNNLLQNLANLDSYGELERLSIAHNQVVRMYWFARMYSLRILNLSGNNIVQIEGLRELQHLSHLNLAGNNLKNIEGINHCLKLEHVNLSGNTIRSVSDLSALKSLKELFLHRNCISSLHPCSKYFPSSLIILTLSDNGIIDLNDVSALSHLNNLEQFTVLNNPCLDPIQPVDEMGNSNGLPLAFDYRPYVINWCLNLKVLDGYKVTPKESLKAEWLYSQGKGRAFQTGEHFALVQYLSGICLAGGGWGGADLPDDDEKLAKILQLAKQHQQELRHSTVNGHDCSESSGSRSCHSVSKHDSPSMHRKVVKTQTRSNASSVRSSAPVCRDGHRRAHSQTASNTSTFMKSGNMTQSYHVELSSTLYGGDLRTPDAPGLMTQSMDPSILSQIGDHLPDSHSQRHKTHSCSSDIMTQSLEPGHLSSILYSEVERRSHDTDYDGANGELPGDVQCSHFPSRPTTLFSTGSLLRKEKVVTSSHLEDTSTFVPAPESIMSPECQNLKSASCQASGSNRNDVIPVTKQRLQAYKYTSSAAKSTSVNQPLSQVSRTTPSANRSWNSPMKSPAVTETRGSPRSQRAESSCSPKANRSPRPAPRYSRSFSAGSTTRKNGTFPSVRKSPAVCDSDSDNTDSEISVSKIQTIKNIAAERRTTARTDKPVLRMQMPYNPEKYKCDSTSCKASVGHKSSTSSNGSSEKAIRAQYLKKTQLQAAVMIQKYWRGYRTREKNPLAYKIRHDIRHTRAEQHIKHLTDRLRSTEEALEKERRLRRLQLEAIRTLWREVQKIQVNRKENGTPSTPMTPLTPLETKEKINDISKKLYSEESVRELTQFCSALQDQVVQLQNSLSMVTQVMNAFCNLPGSQSLLSMSQSSGGDAVEISLSNAHLQESVSSLTHSICALTSSIVTSPSCSKNSDQQKSECQSETTDSIPITEKSAPKMCSDLNSTAQDASTLSIDSGPEDTVQDEAAELSESSQSSLSTSLSGAQITGLDILNSDNVQRPLLRPSSLPVARPLTPRNS